MNRLDDELREALRREEPPEGFAERVLARAAAEPDRQGWWAWLSALFRMPRVRWVAVTAALFLAVLSGLEYQRQQRLLAEGERAKEQVLLALRITANELQQVHHKVQGLNLSR